jgi:hypothetical protein
MGTDLRNRRLSARGDQKGHCVVPGGNRIGPRPLHRPQQVAGAEVPATHRVVRDFGSRTSWIDIAPSVGGGAGGH